MYKLYKKTTQRVKYIIRKNPQHWGFFYFVLRLIICIWIIPITFEIVQYKTNPDGIHANIIVNNIGIQRIIFCVWAVISFAFDVFLVAPDCKYCCNHIVAPIKTGKIKYGSIDAKSDIHKKCALRIGIETNNALYNAKNIGI